MTSEISETSETSETRAPSETSAPSKATETRAPSETSAPSKASAPPPRRAALAPASPVSPVSGASPISARQRRLTLAGSITGAVIVALDGTVLTLAQPAMQRDLHASFVQVQWTSTGYLIAVATLLVFAGRLGDRYGHQRIFAIGVLGFAAASAGIGLAPGIAWVIALRVVQGVFGALLQPATLGTLRAAYPGDRLAMPLALRTSAIGVSAAAGPLIGGALAAHFGWRAVFFIGVAPALAVGVLALVVRLPAPRNASEIRLDLPGACLLGLALVCLVHTLVSVAESGWTVSTGMGLAGATVAGGAFARHERRTANPLIPPSVLRSATVGHALGVLVTASATMFGALFLGTYFLQDVLALDPLSSSLRVLPLAVMMVLAAPLSAMVLRRLGPRRTTTAGMLLVVLGTFLLSRLDQGASFWAIGGGFLVLGAGFGTVMVTATAAIVRHASVENAGVAGGLQQTAMNVGPALGVAVATMLMTLFAPEPAVAHASAGVTRWSGDGFLDAMGPTLVVLAGIALTGAVLAARLPRLSRRPHESGQPR